MPASCQARNRQQVMPEPQPSSCGSISHGMPLRSTKRIPMKQARSGKRGRPPLGLRDEGGSTRENLIPSCDRGGGGFVRLTGKIHGCALSRAEMQQYFRVSPPPVHQMILTSKRMALSGEHRARRDLSACRLHVSIIVAGFALGCSARPRGTVHVKKFLELLSARRFQATQITSKLVLIENVPHRGLKPWKLGRKLRLTVCRFSKVHKLLPDKVVERTLNPETPFDATRRSALLHPDFVKLNATHPATISVGLPDRKKRRDSPAHPPPSVCQMQLACGSGSRCNPCVLTSKGANDG
jgi:hypothetical protein